MRTITIKGRGKSVKDPDLAIINISVSIVKEKFDDALDSMNDLIDELKGSLQNIGFEENDLKTITFNIEQKYDYVEKGIINKEYKNKFVGFQINHNLKLEFDFDNNKLSEVFHCLKNFDEKLEFRLHFSVKDKENMKKEVLINATENAKYKAEILAEASSAKLGDLIKIDYDWVDFNFVSRTNLDVYDDYDAYEISARALFKTTKDWKELKYP